MNGKWPFEAVSQGKGEEPGFGGGGERPIWVRSGDAHLRCGGGRWGKGCSTIWAGLGGGNRGAGGGGEGFKRKNRAAFFGEVKMKKGFQLGKRKGSLKGRGGLMGGRSGLTVGLSLG